MLTNFVFVAFLTASLLAAPLFGGSEDLSGAGKLLIAGGGVKSAKEEMWQRIFEERIEGRPIGIISTASADPVARSSKEAEMLNKEFGENRAVAIPLREGDDSAYDPEVIELIRQCGGFYFTGGKQSRTARALFTEEGERTPALEAIWEVYRQGAVIGGSSAGAAIMSHPMIYGGTSSNALLRGATPVGTAKPERGVGHTFGPGFHPDLLYCQHHIERGRFGRLLAALASDEFPQKKGIGVAEDTFVLVDHRTESGQILGSRGGIYLDATDVKRSADGGFSGVRLHRLERGDSIDFSTGAVQPEAGREEVERQLSGSFRLEAEDAWDRDVIWDLLAGLGSLGPETIGVADDEHFELIFEKTGETEIWRNPAEQEQPRWTITNIHVRVVAKE